MTMEMDRRTVLRGALTIPVVAGALLTFGSGPAAMTATSSAGPAVAPAPRSGSPRVRSWDVETLDRRLRVARS